MSETKTTVPVEALKNVGGGACTPQQYMDILGQLTDAYEQLIDFTGYVIGRVSGDPPAQP
jgi:hypothetical protein